MQIVEPEEVILASPAVIARLLGVALEVLCPPSAGPPPAPAPARWTACACGACKACDDDARWDRIFTEKFADPSYYSGIVVRHDSCLSGA